MKYRCRNCNREFDIPAYIKYTPLIYTPYSPYANPIPTNWPYTAPPITLIGTNYEYNAPCCPFCYSREIEETKP